LRIKDVYNLIYTDTNSSLSAIMEHPILLARLYLW
jgi:hypothetical protein